MSVQSLSNCCRHLMRLLIRWIDGPPPSAHSTQVIRTVLCWLQMDTPQVWQERVVLRSSWCGHALHVRRTPIAAAVWWCQWWSMGKNATMTSACLDASSLANVMSETFWSTFICQTHAKFTQKHWNRRLACELPRWQFGFIVIHNTSALYAAMSTRLKKNATVQPKTL